MLLDLNLLIYESVDTYVDIIWAIRYMNLESSGVQEMALSGTTDFEVISI